ncbi:MAG: ATP-binding protein [Myxococcota bacterium]
MNHDLKDVLDAVFEGVIVVDHEGRVEFLNAEACRLLGTSGEASRGAHLSRVSRERRLEALARGVFESGRSAVQDEQLLTRRFAEDVVVDVAASPLWAEDRTPSGVVLALRDRTLQRSLEERAVERERLSLYGTIAAGIAHEVKNPLGGIRGAAEIIAARTEAGKLQDAANMIVREVDRIRTLVDELMVFNQGESLRLEDVNIHRLLDEVLELLSMDPLARGVKLDRSFDPSIPDLRADPDRLTQIFLNLGRNALQALDGDGTLCVETRMAFENRLTRESGKSVPTVQVTLIDDGPGITSQVLARLSTPFFTTRSGGTGLGLAMSRHWATRHDGTLHLESEPNRGTRARVLLPVVGPQRSSA